MDILNWLYLAKNKFVRTTPSSDKDLMVFGAKVGTTKRGDLYQNYAMSIEDLGNEIGGIKTVAVDGVTITGDGTPGDPLVAAASSSSPFQTFLAEKGDNNIIDIVSALEGTSIPDGASATYTKTIPLPFTAPTAVFGCLLASSSTPSGLGAGLKDPAFGYGISSSGSQTSYTGPGSGPYNTEIRFVAFPNYLKSFRAQTYINALGGAFSEVNESNVPLPGGFEGPTYTELNGTMIGIYNGAFSAGRGIGFSSASASVAQEHTVVKAIYINGNNLVLDLKKRAATSGQTWTKLQFRVYNFS